MRVLAKHRGFLEARRDGARGPSALDSAWPARPLPADEEPTALDRLIQVIRHFRQPVANHGG